MTLIQVRYNFTCRDLRDFVHSKSPNDNLYTSNFSLGKVPPLKGRVAVVTMSYH
jgi:hypothetical protein